MPAVLSDRNACVTTVPFQWKSVLRGLEKFVERERSLRDQKDLSSDDPARVALVALHDRLLKQSARLLEPDALADQTPEADAAVFARATLAAMRIEQATAAGRPQVLDTAGSRALSHFEPDFIASPQNQQLMRRALLQLPGVDDQQLRQIEQQLERDMEDADRKQRVVAALREEFQLWNDAPDLRQNVFRFFSTCYPDTGLRPDDIEIIVTGCMIFFCLPFSGTELLDVRSDVSEGREVFKTREFLQRVARFAHWQFAHFPVFGFLRGDTLPTDLLAELARHTRLSAEQVAREISRLIAIVPLHEVDKYVVHDVWGHGWQASILRYDDLYEQLARYADPLTLAERTRGLAGERFCLDDCLRGHGEQLTLDVAAFRRFVELEVLERLPVAMTPVLAEVIADVSEFKFVELRPEEAEVLKSSSYLTAYPSKLDLTLQDVFYYFQQATKLFRLFATRRDRQAGLARELVERGASSESARRIVEQMVATWEELEQDFYSPRLAWRVAADGLHVNVVTRLALNFLGVHRAVLKACEEVHQWSVSDLPFKSFRDVMLIAAAVFFEADPPRNLWRVDEFLALRIEPLCRQLAQSISR